MAKPKAPRWLTQAFADGVDELERAERRPRPAYRGACDWCWLAEFDPRHRPCDGPLERFHFVNRQRVEAIMWQHLLEARIDVEEPCLLCRQTGADPRNVLQACPGCDGAKVQTYPTPMTYEEVWDLIQLAGWDPRNAGWGCEHHHRRLDGHRTPGLVVPITALPQRVIEFSRDYGTESALGDRFPSP